MGIFRRRGLELVVESGRISCPVWGDGDLERCFNCPGFKTFKVDSPRPLIICRGPRGEVVASLGKFHPSGWVSKG